MKKSKNKYTIGTAGFLAILIISVLGSVIPIHTTILWLILAICGAIVAIQNIQIKEENSFLIGTATLIVVIIAILIIPEFGSVSLSPIGSFLVNLVVGFGVAGFVVALGLISRLGLER